MYVRRVWRFVVRVAKVLYDPIEQARAKRMLASAILGLIIALSAKPIVNWITGGMLDKPPKELTKGGAANAPSFWTMVNNALNLFTWIAVVIALFAIIYAGIKFKTAE